MAAYSAMPGGLGAMMAAPQAVGFGRAGFAPPGEADSGAWGMDIDMDPNMDPSLLSTRMPMPTGGGGMPYTDLASISAPGSGGRGMGGGAGAGWRSGDFGEEDEEEGEEEEGRKREERREVRGGHAGIRKMVNEG